MKDKSIWVNDCILRCTKCNSIVKCYFLNEYGETNFCPNCASNKLEELEIEHEDNYK